MSTSTKVTPVKECISYIESCGWTFDYYNRPWYVFKQEGKSSITFTITELRDAFNNGW
jgi:hypothetical protein